MRVCILYFDYDPFDGMPQYFHLCRNIRENDRWYRDGNYDNCISVSKIEHSTDDDRTLVDPEMFDFLMDKFGTLEGTYAEWEL